MGGSKGVWVDIGVLPCGYIRAMQVYTIPPDSCLPVYLPGLSHSKSQQAKLMSEKNEPICPQRVSRGTRRFSREYAAIVSYYNERARICAGYRRGLDVWSLPSSGTRLLCGQHHGRSLPGNSALGNHQRHLPSLAFRQPHGFGRSPDARAVCAPGCLDTFRGLAWRLASIRQ